MQLFVIPRKLHTALRLGRWVMLVNWVLFAVASMLGGAVIGVIYGSDGRDAPAGLFAAQLAATVAASYTAFWNLRLRTVVLRRDPRFDAFDATIPNQMRAPFQVWLDGFGMALRQAPGLPAHVFMVIPESMVDLLDD